MHFFRSSPFSLLIQAGENPKIYPFSLHPFSFCPIFSSTKQRLRVFSSNPQKRKLGSLVFFSRPFSPNTAYDFFSKIFFTPITPTATRRHLLQFSAESAHSDAATQPRIPLPSCGFFFSFLHTQPQPCGYISCFKFC